LKKLPARAVIDSQRGQKADHRQSTSDIQENQKMGISQHWRVAASSNLAPSEISTSALL